MATDTWNDNSDNWSTAADWSGGVPVSTSNVVVDQGNPQVTSAIVIASLSATAQVTFLNAGASAVTGSVASSGTLAFDQDNGQGGSSLTIGGTLTNSGTVNIGNAYLASATTVSATSLTNYVSSNLGTINITGDYYASDSAPISATLDIGGAAGFGAAGSLTGSVNLTGNALGHAVLEFASGQITTIGASSELTLYGPDAFLADASNTQFNSALTSLATITGTITIRNGAAVTTGNAVTNTGTTNQDNNNGDGGSTLSVGGLLTNSGHISLGNNYLTAATSITASSLTNFIGTNLGTIYLSGDYYNSNSSPISATVNLSSAAGLGAAGSLIGSVDLTGDAYGHALLEFASGEITTIAASSELTLYGPDAFVADASNTGANSALTSLATITGAITLRQGASVLTNNNVKNTGTINVDNNNGDGGSSLSIGGVLTNTGTVNLGNNYLTTTTSITATGLTNFVGSSLGSINISGDYYTSDSTPINATVNLSSAAGFGAAGLLIGSVNLTGDAYGHALLEFASGQITTISGSSQLTLYGPDAFVADASNTTSNSALTSLATITGAMTLRNGAAVLTNNAVTNTGATNVDNNNGDGGSKLAVGGALTNSGTVNIGNNYLTSATNVTATGLNNFVGSTLGTINISGDFYSTSPVPISAILDVSSAAGFGTASTLKGSVNLYGSVNGSGIVEFASGEITTIAANSELTLYGPDAFVADASNTTSNSALTSLAIVTGGLTLRNGATVSTNNAVTNTGAIYVDNNNGDGGSTLAIGGALTNTGTLDIGNNYLSTATNVTATGLTNFVGSTLGTINISGDYYATAPLPLTTTFSISSAAGFGTASTLVGSVNIYGDADGSGILEFASGEITTIAANSELTLYGPDAFVADASNSASNSALTSLSTVTGNFTLRDGASVITSASLTINGQTFVDSNNGDGGSTLTIGGELTNGGNLYLGNGYLSSGSTISANALDNTSMLYVQGSSSATALLSVSTTTLNTGTINVEGGSTVSLTGAVSGAGAIDISGGGVLSLGGNDKGGTLSFGSGGGELTIVDGARVSQIENFTSQDTIDLDSYASTYQAEFFVTSTGGTLEIVDTSNDAVIAALGFAGSFAGEAFALTSDGSGGTKIGLTSAPFNNPQPGDVVITPPAAAGYSSYQYDYTHGNFVGSQFDYTNITNEPYTTEEVDYNGAGQATRAAFTGVTGEPYSAYEYNYVGGVFAGSSFTYTNVPNGAAYSSYVVDDNQSNQYSGEQFFYTNVTGQSYTGEEVDYDANLNLSRVLLTGVEGQPYSSIEYDYSAGTYEGYKAFYAVTGQSYTNEEVDVSAANQIEKVIYSGVSGQPYQSIEQDYVNGALDDTIFGFTDVTGQSYYAYQVTDNTSGAGLQETFDLNSGSHSEVALASGQTLTSLGNDKMTGSGATNFVFNAIYGAGIITNLTSADTVSMPSSEFANFQAMFGDASNSGANVLIEATDGDTLTLKNLTTTGLQVLSADFKF